MPYKTIWVSFKIAGQSSLTPCKDKRLSNLLLCLKFYSRFKAFLSRIHCLVAYQKFLKIRYLYKNVLLVPQHWLSSKKPHQPDPSQHRRTADKTPSKTNWTSALVMIRHLLCRSQAEIVQKFLLSKSAPPLKQKLNKGYLHNMTNSQLQKQMLLNESHQLHNEYLYHGFERCRKTKRGKGLSDGSCHPSPFFHVYFCCYSCWCQLTAANGSILIEGASLEKRNESKRYGLSWLENFKQRPSRKPVDSVALEASLLSILPSLLECSAPSRRKANVFPRNH